VWFGGHSLGAALATLAAARFPTTAGVSTIASPRVGDRLFAALFDARFGGRSLRYENDTDIVTLIPPPRLDHFVGDVFGDVGHLREVVQALHTGVMRRAPDFLLDHMPRGYTVDVWNDLEANGPT
jgi:triacylglycerol lipase